MRRRFVSVALLLSIMTSDVAWLSRPLLSYAASDDLKEEVDTLQDQVKERQSRIDALDKDIKKYRERIQAQEKEVVTLKNQLGLLESLMEEKRLAVERARDQIDLTGLEIESLRGQIAKDELTISRRQASIAELLRELRNLDRVSTLEMLFARPSLSELFTRQEELKSLQGDLTEATQSLKDKKQKLTDKRKEMETRRVALEKQRVELEEEQEELEEQAMAKTSLVSQTQSKEEEFQRILYELRQEQQSEANTVLEMQRRLKDKLNSVDTALARGDILLNWPVVPRRGVSAHFHDKSYPFRQLFEHSGTDIPVPVGTPVKAAAGGYVAWNRTGKQYGNYVMLVHPGGIATVYAHLSKFAVEPDSYVDRGDIIGYSGGRPGDPGAGLSTGPHLHFEVRQNGIPVNPENFLPDLD